MECGSLGREWRPFSPAGVFSHADAPVCTMVLCEMLACWLKALSMTEWMQTTPYRSALEF